MTLVVARMTPLGVRVAADMRVTDRNATRPSGFAQAALKPILLSPTRCIAYAGNVGVALGAIRKTASENMSDDAAQSHLLETHQRHREHDEQRTDFLMASLRPSRLIEVKSGCAQECAPTWLGDGAAFDEYQREYHQSRGKSVTSRCA
jgi:hypothetical protein